MNLDSFVWNSIQDMVGKCSAKCLIKDKNTDHFWYLTVRNPLKTSPSELTWCRLSSMITEGNSSALELSHWSAMLARYWRNSLLDLWSTLKVAMLPEASSLSTLKENRLSVLFILTNMVHSLYCIETYVQIVPVKTIVRVFLPHTLHIWCNMQMKNKWF